MVEPGPLVELRGVSFSYRREPVLQEIDLALGATDSLAVLGPNGGGKTTLLRILLGLLPPSSGEVRWARPRARLAYVPQFPTFDRGFPLRLEEMVVAGLLHLRPPLRPFRRADRRAAHEILEQLGLGELAGARLSELSGGQLKRALIARALVGEPELLALDEPSAALDEASRGALHDLLVARRGRLAMVLVTHDPGSLVGLFERAVWIDRRLVPGHLHSLDQSAFCTESSHV